VQRVGQPQVVSGDHERTRPVRQRHLERLEALDAAGSTAVPQVFSSVGFHDAKVSIIASSHERRADVDGGGYPFLKLLSSRF
jgi:hypothetical protein